MTPKDFLTNPHFCPMPFTGLMYNHDGSVRNCIRSGGKLGNLKDNTIEEILHNSINTQTQQNMLDRRPGGDCYTCYELENNKKRFDIISDRVFYLKELKTVPLDTYKVGNHQLNAIDVRWTNLCNFACVYCSSDFSSRWAEEMQIKIDKPTDAQLEKFKEYIFNHASTLKHVYLAGGEPLLMKQNLELLELLYIENPNVNLRINTNLSKVDTKVFDQICKFKNVHWTVSVESIETEFEYIRFGASWQDFVSNLKIIQQLDHKVSFNMLWFLLNYNSIFECVDFLKDFGFHNNSFIIGALLKPEYLNIRHLPNTVLQSLEELLQQRIDQHPGYLLEDSYRNMLNYLTKPFDKNIENSLSKIATLDQRRNLNSRKIFANLYNLI